MIAWTWTKPRTAGSGKISISEWTDLVWSEGLMDASGRVGSSCGADAPEYHPEGPIVAGVGQGRVLLTPRWLKPRV